MDFSLSIKKAFQAYGCSLIIMSIVGGAIMQRIFDYISDSTGNIQLGYTVPLACLVARDCVSQSR